MKIDIIKVGSLETNCYLLSIGNKCLIIDPGAEENKIIRRIREQELTPLAIIITHNHFDHNSEALSISRIYNIKIFDHDSLFEQNHSIGPFKFKVIYTPGHTKDSITLYFPEEKAMFVGDFLFYEDIGYTHFKGGSHESMLKSLDKIKEYPDNITIYPGHDRSTTLQHEKKYNKYLDFDIPNEEE